MCVCVCVCVCVYVCERDPLNEHVVANSALYVVTVNDRDAPSILDVLGRKLKMLCNNYFFH